MSRNEIISIFHHISTDNPNIGKSDGVFIVFRLLNEINFCWREYVNQNSNQQKNEILIKISNVQSIMISHQKSEGYVLINTKNPSCMHQFFFPKDSSYQLLNFAQTLAIIQQMDKTDVQDQIENAFDFISESFVSNKQNYHLFEISVDNGELNLPPDFTMNGIPQKIDFVEPDLHIISKFGVQSKDFVEKPLVLEEFKNIKTLDELKVIVKNHGVDPSIRHIVWPYLLNVISFNNDNNDELLKHRLDEYNIIKNQWVTLSKTQIKYFNIVRDAFTTIRVDVKRTHPTENLKLVKNWNTILTNILNTFVFWNIDVRYTQGLNDLAINIMNIFVPDNKMEQDVAEAMSFWCFSAFVEKISSGLLATNMMIMQEKELSQVFVIIEKFHPACAKWFRTNGLDDLSFLISPFILSYGRTFSQEIIARLWEALICVETPWLFLRYFSACLLILSFPTFQKIQNYNGKFVSLIDQIFFKQDIGSIICISLSMMYSEHPNIQPCQPKIIQAKPVKQINDMKIFEPDSKFTDYYSVFDNLFK